MLLDRCPVLSVMLVYQLSWPNESCVAVCPRSSRVWRLLEHTFQRAG